MSDAAPRIFSKLRASFRPQQDSLGALGSAVPMAVQQTLNPPNATGSTVKEAKEPSFTIEKPGIDQVPGLQYVEEEPQHELPPEVEEYVKEVENHQEQIPSEVVVADHQAPQQSTHYLAKPVIVLPITPEIEKKGAHKSSSFSVRWLVEWSRKIMKMFRGQIVYKQA